MAEKLTFNLVSPERELFADDVDEVIVPGVEGEFGVLADHSPFMSVLAPGLLVVKNGGTEKQLFVRGGFADVTPAGLTVLAEFAVPVEELKGDVLVAQKELATADLAAAEEPDAVFQAQKAVDTLAAF